MNNIIPITHDTYTLSDRSVFTMIQERKWAYISENGPRRPPQYVVVGGSFLSKLEQELKESPLLRQREGPVTFVHGLILVKTKKHMIEVGE